MVFVARLAQSVEHQTFRAENFSETSEGHGFKSHIGRELLLRYVIEND